ncbi:hypothetical protein ALC60_05859 [Trachymyrmex zeteki]|uniref:Uncharacterized protein n=1 Tax=Mycetomoellerius zeteki TaxID=64791 RepID=A0A151X4M1_9HYME|nr:hypothetical protein ALC60_05859 [Trachymyrmex zeteki]
MPTGIINLNTEGQLSPTLFHPANPERYELSTHTYAVNCIGKARVYDASSPDFVPNVTKQESITDDSIEQVFTTNGFRIFS